LIAVLLKLSECFSGVWRQCITWQCSNDVHVLFVV